MGQAILILEEEIHRIEAEQKKISGNYHKLIDKLYSTRGGMERDAIMGEMHALDTRDLILGEQRRVLLLMCDKMCKVA